MEDVMKMKGNHIFLIKKMVVSILYLAIFSYAIFGQDQIVTNVTQYDQLKNSINCDSIYPDKNMITLDTSLSKPGEIKLVPRYGSVIGSWFPTDYLSCTDCQTPVAFPQTPITYTVSLTDTNNCIHQESFKIDFKLNIPNVITPNGDGLNDSFKIYGLPSGTPIKIFDKDGHLVYSANSYSEANWWTGTDNNGKPLEAGTYWYVLDNSLNGIYEKGFVLLVR